MFRLKVHAGRAQDMLTGGAFVLLLGAMLLVIYLWTASIPVKKYASDTFDHYNFDEDVLKDAYADLVGNLDAEGGGDGVIDQDQGCRLAPVGVDDTLQKIPAEQLTASSALPGAEASRGRLNYKAVSGGEGAWVPERQDRGQWIQVDLGRDLVVGGVVTQGSDDEANPGFVTSYKLSYSLTGDYWITYSNVTAPEMLFSGNSNGRDPVRNQLESPVRARYIRVSPQDWQHRIALRLELLHCENKT
ncbi:lactadherin-like isoform X1 [Branchiostoma floridae x Branchiostoma belcheri]